MRYQRERKQLADRLRSLRDAAGLSGEGLARKLGGGWKQPKVSKIENGRQLPSEEDVRAWCAAVGAPDAVDEVLTLLADAQAERTEFKEVARSIGIAGVQAEILALEAHTTRIGEYQPSMISGLVQTAEYADEALHISSGPGAFGSSEDDIRELIGFRLQRQRVLYDPSKRVEIVMLESALRVRLCSEVTFAGQLDRLLALTGLPSLELTIVPFHARVPVFPMGFRLYDDDLVIVESLSNEEKIEDAETVAKYVGFFDDLRHVGVTGADAAALIQRALAELRSS